MGQTHVNSRKTKSDLVILSEAKNDNGTFVSFPDTILLVQQKEESSP
jgi:hypothetical protein